MEPAVITKAKRNNQIDLGDFIFHSMSSTRPHIEANQSFCFKKTSYENKTQSYFYGVIFGQKMPSTFYLDEGIPYRSLKNIEHALWYALPCEPTTISGIVDPDKKILSEFVQRVRSLAKSKGIQLLSYGIRDWVSEEDLSWKKLLPDLVVKTNSKTALSFWDELSEELNKFINKFGSTRQNELQDKLSLSVRWV